MHRLLISLALLASSTLAGYWAFAPKGLCFVRSPGDTAWCSWLYADSKEDSTWFHTQTLTLSSQKASWDCAAGGVAELTITGTGDSLRSPTNLKAGRLVDVTIIQDGTGSRTLLWGSAFKWPGAVAPTLTSTAAARDKFLFRLTATTAELVTATFDVR